MPRKVEFCVIYASSEDDKFRAVELNEHGPTVRGWQSSKDCSYPQEIIFKLSEPVVLVQAQILSHQYLISSRIDLWIGPETSVEPDQLPELSFEYLGYVTLADNRASSYKSRELKSVAIPSPEKTRFFKISLHSNHVNKYNEFNQVGLVAIQLLGEDKGDHGDVSVFDDLSFEMYVDKEVAKIIRQMELKKEEAVKNERFRYAGRLKSAMLTLREVGEKLGRLEVGKVHAIANEDYARATRKKEQMDTLRNETYLMIGVKDLLEEDGVNPKNDAANSEATDSTTTLSEEVLIVPKSPDPTGKHEVLGVTLEQNPVSPVHFTPSVTKTTPTIVQPIRTGSLRRKKVVSPNSAKNSYEAYDERVIPVQRSTSSKDTSSGTITNINPSCLKMNEREKKQASLAISVFGIALVEKFFSKQYVDKEDGLRDLESILESQEPTNKLFRASTLLLHRALRDKVISVYTIAAALIAQLFTKYVGPRVTTSELTRSVDKLLPELFLKSGDPTPRVHNTAVHTILAMAHSSEMRKLNIIPVHLTRPLTASTHPRLALSKLEMVEQLILSIGISSDKQSGMTCRTLAEFGASGLHHPAEAVRKVAERVLILVYRVNPRLVRKQLPPDDDITRRNLLYRQLMKEFDKIDLEVKCDIQTIHPSAMKTSVSSYATSRALEPVNVTGGQDLETPSSLPSGNKQCIFCFQVCEDFTEEGLNIHYWKYCPMLTRCIHCQEVLEATGIHRHLTVDCELKELYKRCEICGESVLNQTFIEHVQSCTGESRCPYCQQPVENADASWRAHLLDGKTCPKHPRAKYIVKKETSSSRDYSASPNA